MAAPGPRRQGNDGGLCGIGCAPAALEVLADREMVGGGSGRGCKTHQEEAPEVDQEPRRTTGRRRMRRWAARPGARGPRTRGRSARSAPRTTSSTGAVPRQLAHEFEELGVVSLQSMNPRRGRNRPAPTTLCRRGRPRAPRIRRGRRRNGGQDDRRLASGDRGPGDGNPHSPAVGGLRGFYLPIVKIPFPALPELNQSPKRRRRSFDAARTHRRRGRAGAPADRPPDHHASRPCCPPLGLLGGDRHPLGRRREPVDLVLLSLIYVIRASGSRSASTATSRTAVRGRPRGSRRSRRPRVDDARRAPSRQWVTDHRKHHALSDSRGRSALAPRRQRLGRFGVVAGMWHAHVGWLFRTKGLVVRAKYGRDLLEDTMIRDVDRLYFVWVAIKFAIPFVVGWWLGGWPGGSRQVWGGLVRISVFQHARGPSTRSVTCRAARFQDARREPQQLAARDARRCARPGTTTTTPSPSAAVRARPRRLDLTGCRQRARGGRLIGTSRCPTSRVRPVTTSKTPT